MKIYKAEFVSLITNDSSTSSRVRTRGVLAKNIDEALMKAKKFRGVRNDVRINLAVVELDLIENNESLVI